jgi:hypothetical protein
MAAGLIKRTVTLTTGEDTEVYFWVADTGVVNDDALPAKVIVDGVAGTKRLGVYVEDEVAPNDPTGLMLLARRRTTPVNTEVSADNDVIALNTDDYGNLRVFATFDPDAVNEPGDHLISESPTVNIASDQVLPVTVGSVPTKYVTVSMSTPTDAQDVGDVIAATQIVAACTAGNDLPGILQSATIIDTDDQKAILRLVFFSANTSLGTEDSAPDIDDTEALTVLGDVDIAVADYHDYGGASIANIKNIGLGIVPATGTDDIYMAIYSPATSTPTYASGVITVRLGFI